jgi:C-terminal processing protease CtpA/Prc
VFAVAYWSNIWGGPFLEERDGTGWSNAYASTITDPDNDNEIIGGTLIVWAPDDEQGFPDGFGEDGLLFTADDPVTSIPAGYSLVDLNQEPFRIYKEARPNIDMIEGELAINDFSELSYVEAFDALFQKASREYPFTELKSIDWESLYDLYAPRIENASSAEEFYTVLRDFTYEIPDGHVGLSINPDIFFFEQGGSFGLVLTELSDGRLIASEVLPGTPGAQAGIFPGAEIISWNGKPAQDALDDVLPYFSPYSTEHTKRINQAVFLTRVPPGEQVEIEYRNPDANQIESEVLTSIVEYDSLFRSIPAFNEDELALPIQAEVMDDSMLGYLRVNTFDDDYHLMAQLWERHIQDLIDNEIEGLVIDLRANSGGSSGLAYNFAGYFIGEEITLYTGSYYNDQTGQFELEDYPARLEPAPLLYEGPIAVLVGPDCVSACEGFAHALTMSGRAIVVGHYPTAGAFGEVGRGQYEMPDDLSMQFPTGRPVGPDGEIIIEGTGIIPDILVPITEESALGLEDTILLAAIEALLENIR